MKLTTKHVENLLNDIKNSDLDIVRAHYVYLGPDYNRTYPMRSNLLQDRLIYGKWIDDLDDLGPETERQRAELLTKHPILAESLIVDGESFVYKPVVFELYVSGIKFSIEAKSQDYPFRHYLGYSLEDFSVSTKYSGNFEIGL